jgi:Adenosine deaminase
VINLVATTLFIYLPMPKVAKLKLFWSLLVCSSFVVAGVTAAAKEPPTAQRTSQRPESQVSAWFEKHRNQPPALRAFIQRMPKGGDIHTHLSGAVYAEHYLKWAAADGYCVDPTTPALIEPSACAQSSKYFPASELFNRSDVYDALIDRFSTRNLAFAKKSGHDRFFEAFGDFGAISSAQSRQGDMVAAVANRAAAQQISYLELMLTVQGSEVRQLGKKVGWNRDFAKLRQQLLDRGLMDLVQKGSQDFAALERDVKQKLGCGTVAAQPGCGVTIRYLQQTTRTKSPVEVFAQFAYAFELAKVDSRVVGLNLVAPEDHPVALRDYPLQMEMLKFLHSQSPNTNISLHAGELKLGLVPPDELRFHIRQAVEIAQAKRIGHGVDVMFENNPFELMAQMKQRGVLVEICPTSNEVILNVKGEDHPFRQYWAAGVPLTIASDDEGISRSDLSNEYLLVAQRYGLGYRDLKHLARNSLEYSFLKGESLWRSRNFIAISPACNRDIRGTSSPSARCAAFLNKNDRARTQWQLESEFAQFETLPWLRPMNRSLESN